MQSLVTFNQQVSQLFTNITSGRGGVEDFIYSITNQAQLTSKQHRVITEIVTRALRGCCDVKRDQDATNQLFNAAHFVICQGGERGMNAQTSSSCLSQALQKVIESTKQASTEKCALSLGRTYFEEKKAGRTQVVFTSTSPSRKAYQDFALSDAQGLSASQGGACKFPPLHILNRTAQGKVTGFKRFTDTQTMYRFVVENLDSMPSVKTSLNDWAQKSPSMNLREKLAYLLRLEFLEDGTFDKRKSFPLLTFFDSYFGLYFNETGELCSNIKAGNAWNVVDGENFKHCIEMGISMQDLRKVISVVATHVEGWESSCEDMEREIDSPLQMYLKVNLQEGVKGEETVTCALWLLLEILDSTRAFVTAINHCATLGDDHREKLQNTRPDSMEVYTETYVKGKFSIPQDVYITKNYMFDFIAVVNGFYEKMISSTEYRANCHEFDEVAQSVEKDFRDFLLGSATLLFTEYGPEMIPILAFLDSEVGSPLIDLDVAREISITYPNEIKALSLFMKYIPREHSVKALTDLLHDGDDYYACLFLFALSLSEKIEKLEVIQTCDATDKEFAMPEAVFALTMRQDLLEALEKTGVSYKQTLGRFEQFVTPWGQPHSEFKRTSTNMVKDFASRARIEKWGPFSKVELFSVYKNNRSVECAAKQWHLAKDESPYTLIFIGITSECGFGGLSTPDKAITNDLSKRLITYLREQELLPTATKPTEEAAACLLGAPDLATADPVILDLATHDLATHDLTTADLATAAVNCDDNSSAKTSHEEPST